jgi:hypothetical protein
MKIVFAIHHAGAFRTFDRVVRHLCSRGHQVKVLHGNVSKPIVMDRALKACQDEVGGCDAEALRLREHWLGMANMRELVNCTNYVRPHHPAPWLARRWRNKIRQPMRFVVKCPGVMSVLALSGVYRTLRGLERIIPPDPAVTRHLAVNKPDVVVASPFINPVSKELEYIKAAEALNIPTVVALLSWDNLTSKGTFHVIPDLTLVWNDALAKEAALLHDVPADRIVLTGAPTFDFWFEMKPSTDYRAFCSRIGIDEKKPFILYLSSSPYIGKNETPFVRAFCRTLFQQEGTEKLSVVVRPHPTNAPIWNGFEEENVAVWPRDGAYVDTSLARQDYYDTIFHASAVVGVNTSAVLEAAIVDKPCVTIMTDHYRAKQTGTGHFRHLLQADFMEIGDTFSGASSIIAGILEGRDTKSVQRKRFVREFIRPRGMEKQASLVMAKEIEAAALAKSSRKRTKDDNRGHLKGMIRQHG